MPKTAFTVLEPDCRSSAVVFASPHSACDYPEWFVRRSLLNAHSIRSSEDAFVDRLFEAAPLHGAPFLKAGAPRAFLDLNRSVDELDPALIKGVRKVGHNPRVASGLGVIPRVVANGRPIYSGKLSLEEANRRIDSYWRPYHARLQQLLNESIDMCGRAVLIDCHSMPNEALDSMAHAGRTRPDIVLGDRFGASSDSEIVDLIEDAFLGAGLNITRNTPFAGAYVTQHYGRPSRKQHAVQIEINRSLYMDEARIEPRSDFAEFQSLLATVIGKIAEIGRPGQRLAAE